MKRNNLFFLRNIGDTFFLVLSDDLEENEKRIVVLNESSAFLWKKMENSFTVDDLVIALSERYEVSNEVAHQHVTEFISFLFENGCLNN